MGLFGLGKKKVNITGEMTVGLTELGKTKAETFSAEGKKFEIIATLAERGPSQLSEISGETRIPLEQVKFITKSLIRAGYVRAMTAESVMTD